MTQPSLSSGYSFVASADERALCDALRRYCEREIVPYLRVHGEQYIPRERMREFLRGLSTFGLVGGSLAERHGGAGLSWKTVALLLEELCVTSVAIGVTALIQTMVATLAERLFSETLLATYLPRILSCDLIGCIAISEPGAGSNVSEVSCTAKEIAQGYSLSGEKTWISNGDYAELCLCAARTGAAATDIDLFLVDRQESPFGSRNIHKMALNGTSTAQLFFTNCTVPAGHRLTRSGHALRQVAELFGVSRPLVAMMSIGLGRAALAASISYATERRQHGKAIAAHQLISGYLAEMATQIDASRLLALRAFDLIDRGIRCEAESAMAKWFATELAVNITSRAIQIHGGNGVTTDFPVERLFREARICPIPEGTTEINKLIIGRALTGLSAI